MKKILLSLTAFFLVTCLLTAGTVEKTYHFSNPKVSEANGYEMISFENTLLTGLAGEPTLPYQSVSLLLPAGFAASNIEIITGNEIILDGTYQIYPQQHSQPTSKGESGVFVKNEVLYLSDVSYPASQVGQLSTQYMNGFAVAMSAFTPVKYNPATGKVSYYETVTVVVKTISDLKSSTALHNINTSKAVKERLTSLVQNSEMISTYPTRDNRTDDYDMIIVTPSQFEASFAPLIAFYAVRGMNAKVATTQTIYSTMTGQDNPAKIRNYIIQEYQNNGVQHIFLGGDVEHVPYRGFYCHVQSSSVYEDDNIPSDLYYSGLDGNWNTDGDGKWAEIGEDDLLPDVGVARFSFSSQVELTSLLHKTMSYQGSPVLGELQKPLLAGEYLYGDPYETWGSDYLELLIGNRTDNGYETTGIPLTDNIERLYDEDGTWSASTLLQKINTGKSFIHHVGHANSTYTMKMSNSDITNANFSQVNGIIHNYTLVYSHGCDCGAFDESDCIAERMVNIDNFAVALVMNTRYGWFNEGQTEGPNAHLHREFVDALYTKKENHIGMAHSISRIETSPWVNAPGQWEEGALRWCFYDANVLGDAGLRIWTTEPISITANYQSALPIGVPSISVTVNGNGSYVEGFSCVFMKDGVNYGTGITNAAGQAEIVFTTPITNVGDATIYVAGYNCQVHEFPLTVIPNTGAFVVYASSTINDVNGNNNGIPEYTESILLTSTMKNVGTVQANNVIVTLSSTDPYVTITDNTENFGNIAGGSSVTVENAFAFTIAGNVPDQHAVSFTLLAVGQDSWSSDFSVTVSAPALEMSNYIINDAAVGNNNGLLDPGETADIILVIENLGGAEAYQVMAGLISNSIYITVNNGTAQELGDLVSGNSAQATFTISAAANIPAGYTAEMVAQIEAMYGIEATGQFSLIFSDYCEASTTTEDEYISNIVFGTINNSSGWQGAVANYTNLSTVMNPGASQQMVVTNGTPWASDIVTVWVDWNRNYEFGDNANETFSLTNVGGTGASFQGNVTVPNNQFGGQYRVRIRMTYSTAPTPCGSASYGEIEDYSLLVNGGIPLGVNVMCNPTEICQGSSSQMTATPTGGSGVYTFSWTPTTGLSNPNIYNPIASPAVTTTYTVNVNDGIQTISSQATITVHELPATPTITLNVLTLQSSSAEGNQWYNSLGIIPGANGQTYTCTTEEDYYVIVTNFFGCASAPSNIIHVLITGINEIDGNSSLNVYPNPFSDKVFIEFNLEAGTSYSLVIYNALGEEIEILQQGTKNAGGNEVVEFSANGLEKGIYFCKLITAENVVIHKIIHTN
jgi:hypothetical protein